MKQQSVPMQAWRKIALRYPETQESTVCTRTAFKARGKAFLFMGANESSYNAMLKLRDSLPEAKKLAAKMTSNYGVGGSGWVTLTFSHNQSPPKGLLERWIDESYRLLSPRQLLASLATPAVSAPRTKPKKKAL